MDQIKTKLKKVVSQITDTIVNSHRRATGQDVSRNCQILRSEVIQSTLAGKPARLVSISPTLIGNQNVIRNLEARSNQSFVHEQEIEVIEVDMEDIEIIEPEVIAENATISQEMMNQNEETEESRQPETTERIVPTDYLEEMTDVIENVQIKTEILDTYVEEDVEPFNTDVVGDEEQQVQHVQEEIEIENRSSRLSNFPNNYCEVEEVAELDDLPVSVQKNVQIDNYTTAEPVPGQNVQNVQLVHVDSEHSQVQITKISKPSSVMKKIEMDPEIFKKMEEQLGTDRKECKFVCEFCGSKKRIFTGLLSLNIHIQNFHETATKIYTCPEPGCDRIFPIKTMLEQHSKSHYSEEIKKPHLCPEPNCLMRFVWKSQWKDHIKRHERKCRFCEFASVPSTAVRTHEVTEHSDQLDQICDQCGERYSLASILETHVQIHETEGPYFCSICKMADALCDEVFLNGDELDTHLISCHVPKELKKSKLPTSNPLNCTICDEGFLKHSQLKQHIKQLHRTEERKPQKTEKLKCEICSKEYKEKRYLIVHMAIHHAEARNLNNQESSLKTCNFCGDQFLSTNLLKNHKILKHYKTSTKTCELCGKVMSSGHYTIHMRMHQGIKPFSCYFCNKRFLRYEELNFHISCNHTMERRFICTICKNDYNHPQGFKIHMNTHYRKRK